MEITQVYTIIAGGVFGILVVIQWIVRTLEAIQRFSLWGFRHLIYPFVLRRHRFIGPWTRNGALLRLLYVAINVFCEVFRVHSVAQAGLRAGNLSLINMIPLFFGIHLGFVADLLGLSLQTYTSIHGSAAVMSILMGCLHIIFTSVSGQRGESSGANQLYGLIVGTTPDDKIF